MAKVSPKYVVVRTYSAGVHIGTLVSQKGKEVRLKDAQRLWSWVGANTLHEVALNGVGVGSKLSQVVPDILLTEAIEVIGMTAKARTAVRERGWST